MTDEYVRVMPPTSSGKPETALEVASGIYRFKQNTELDRLVTEAIGDWQRPIYEFRALSPGESDRVEFLYGADGMDVDKLRMELQDCYPLNFELSPTELHTQQLPAPYLMAEPEALIGAVRHDTLLDDLNIEASGKVVTKMDALEAIKDAALSTPDKPFSDLLLPYDGPIYRDEDPDAVCPAAESGTATGAQQCGSADHLQDPMDPLAALSDPSENVTPALAEVIGFIYKTSRQLLFKFIFERRPP